MSVNPFAGQIPLNRRVDNDKIAKETSFKSGEVHEPGFRNQFNDKTIMPRNNGNEVLRRYPNGTLDMEYATHKIISVLNTIQDRGFITDHEKAIVALVLPDQFKELIDPKIAATMTKISNDERMLLRVLVNRHLKEVQNYNAGRGGGSVEGRSTTRS
jgi:hypothetical protein